MIRPPQDTFRAGIGHKLIFLTGVALLMALLLRLSLSQPDASLVNIYYQLIAWYEVEAFLFLLLGLVGSAYYVRIAQSLRPSFEPPGWLRTAVIRYWIWALAILVFIVSLAGAKLVFGYYDFSLDEYAMAWQGRRFAEGQLHATIPPHLAPLGSALGAHFFIYDPSSHTFVANYLPVYALMRAAMEWIQAPWLLNPLLTGMSVLLLAGIARQVWPHHPDRALLAALLAASSSQIVFTGMSSYSMVAHLFLNLLWLWLFVRATPFALALVPWVGVLSMLLHQPIAHFTFVAPFLLRACSERRWWWSAYLALVYGLGCWVGLWFRQLLAPVDSISGTALKIFSEPSLVHTLSQVLNLGLLFSWESLATVMLASYGIFLAMSRPLKLGRRSARWTDPGRLSWDLTMGLVLTFLFYLFFPHTQGHGWGFRYAHPVLGNLILLAILGWGLLRHRLSRRQAWRWVIVCTALAWSFQFSWRVAEVSLVTRPFKDALHQLQQRPEPYVVLDPYAGWYLVDLVRNEPPFNERPLILNGSRLSPEQFEWLFQEPGRAFLVDRAEAARLGLLHPPEIAKEAQL